MLGSEAKTIESASAINVFEVSVTKKDLVKALAHAQSTIAKQNTTSILGYVLIAANAGHLEFTTTDIDIVLSEKIPAQVVSEGIITMDAAITYEIVRKLDDKEKILLKFDPSTSLINLSSGNCTFQLQTLSPTEFPKLDDLKYDSAFKLGVEELRPLIDKCKFAISPDPNRYSLSGVFMRCQNSCIKLVASDGHRISIASSKPKTGLSEFSGVIIPQKTVNEVRKILEDLSGDIEIHLANNKIKFSNNNFSLTSRLVAAQFPDYESLVPKQYEITLEINKTPFSLCVSRVSCITNEKFRGIKFVVDGDTLTISSHNESVGFAAESIVVNNSNKSRLEVGFNSKYLAEVLDVIKSDKICFSLKDPFSPAVITEDGNADFMYIIMPMRA